MGCPCSGKTRILNKRIMVNNVDCGLLHVEICEDCKSEYFSEKIIRTIENRINKAKPRRYEMHYLDKFT